MTEWQQQWLRAVEFLKTLPVRLQFDYRSPTEAGTPAFTKWESPADYLTEEDR